MPNRAAALSPAIISVFLDELELLGEPARRRAVMDLIELASAVAATHGAGADDVEAAVVAGYRHGAATMAASRTRTVS